MGLFRKLLYIIRYKTKGAGRMLDHNIYFWFVAQQLTLPLGLYRSTPNDFKNVIITIFQNYFGDSRRVERLCSGFPAHSE